MENSERQELLEQAQQMITEAQQMVDEAVNGTDHEANYLAYGRYGFDQLLGNGNPYDDSIDTLLSRIQK